MDPIQTILQALKEGKITEADANAWVDRETGGRVKSFAEYAQGAQGQPQPEEPGILGGMLRSAAEGASMGWSGELAGIGNKERGEQWQRDLDAFKERHKYLALASELGGGLAGAVAAPGALLGKLGIGAGAGLLGRIGTGLAIGAAEGAVAGAGYANEGERGAGALGGGLVGGAFGGALPITGAIGRGIYNRGEMLLSPEKAVAKLKMAQLAEAVNSGKASIDELVAEFKRMNDVAPGLVTFGDLTPQTRRMLDNAATQSPVAQELIQDAMEGRKLNRTRRMVETLEDVPGVGAVDAGAVQQIQKRQLQKLGKELFEGIELSPSERTQMSEFFKRPIIKDAARAAEARHRMAGIRAEAPTFEQAQHVKDFLGKAYQRTRDINFQKAQEQLDEILFANPAYAAAAPAYRSQRVLVDALEEGGEVWSHGRPARVRERIAQLEAEGGPAAADAFRYSMLDKMQNELRGEARGAAARRLMTRSKNVNELLEAAFPDKATLDRILAHFDVEKTLSKAEPAGMGSATARRTFDDEATALAAGSGVAEGVGSGAVMGGPQGAVAGGLAATAHAFRDVPNRLQGRVAEAMAPDLLGTGDQVTNLLRMIGDRNKNVKQMLDRMALVNRVRAATGGLLAGKMAGGN